MLNIILLILLAINSLTTVNSRKDCDKLIVAGVEAMNEKDHVKSLELLTRVKATAEEHQWYEQLFLAVNNIGANYYSMLDYGEALNNYLAAYTIAIKHLTEEQEMIVLNNIAVLYSKERQFGKAEEYFLKAYQLAKSTNTKLRIGMYAINLGIVANEKGELTTALAFFDEARRLLKDEPQLVAQIDIALAENHLLNKKFGEAGVIASRFITEKTSIQNIIPALLILSRVNEAQGYNAKAIYFARQALNNNPTTEDKIAIYERLAELNVSAKQYPEALIAKDSLLKAKEEFNVIKNGRLFETNRVKFEIQNYQKELLKNQEKIRSERKTFFAVLGVALLIIILITWALRNSYIKNRQRKIIQERSKEILRLELEKKNTDNLLLERQLREKEAIALLEEERLKNEIEIRNRKLAAKALHLSHRSEIIEDIINSLTNQPGITGNDKLMMHLKELKGQLKSEGEWEDFLTHFEEANHGFLTSLKQKHPALTSNDIRFLSYVYINLSTKEISSLLNITPEACRKRKERILRKMDLPVDTELFDYLTGKIISEA